MKYDPEDIFAVALNDAPAALVERIKADAESDPALAQQLAQAKALSHAGASLRARDAQAFSRAAAAARQEIRARKVTSSLSWEAPARFSFARLSLGAAAVAACVLFAIIGFTQLQSSSPVGGIIDIENSMAKHTPAEPAAVETSFTDDAIRMYITGPDSRIDASYQSLTAGLSKADPGATVRIQSAQSAEAMRLDRPMTLLAVGGSVRIGEGAKTRIN